MIFDLGIFVAVIIIGMLISIAIAIIEIGRMYGGINPMSWSR